MTEVSLSPTREMKVFGVVIAFIWLLLVGLWFVFYAYNFSIWENIGIVIVSLAIVAILEITLWLSKKKPTCEPTQVQPVVTGCALDVRMDSTTATLYKAYSDLYSQTRSERLEYNKYFITLLFTSTLFAIFTTIFGATAQSQYKLLALYVLIAVLFAAIGISIVWACKLWTESQVSAAQLNALAKLEQTLFGFAAICPLGSAQMEFDFGKGLRGWYRRGIWHFNYWALPVLFAVIFAFLIGILWFGRNELFFSIFNATQNASSHAFIFAAKNLKI
jgi:hypothetical protein